MALLISSCAALADTTTSVRNLGAADWAAIISAFAAIASWIAAIVAIRKADHALQNTRRQALFELANQWANVNDVDTSRPLIGPAVKHAVNALNTTASCWTHNVVDHDVILDQFWRDFDQIFLRLAECDIAVPGYANLTCRQCVTDEVRKAHLSMHQMSHERTTRSNAS
jgi:hypothetical protein